jgi:hypothetical protein
MPRPQVEFIHAQQLPWRPAPFGDAAWSGVEAKVLSRDPADGACSALLRFPAGWHAPPVALDASLEFLLLDGELAIGALSYGLDAYAFLPAGYPLARRHSARGAVALAFFDREPRARAAAGADWDRRALIERIDTHALPWTRHDIDPSVQFLNLAHKVLREVVATGEKTILLSSGAQTHPKDWREAQLAHDCVEEMYLLGGDIIGERGVMYEGAYFWRPPGIWHGPFGSRRGSLSLIRFCEGRHHNTWSDAARPFVLEPAHAPVLPPGLAAAAATPWVPERF